MYSAVAVLVSLTKLNVVLSNLSLTSRVAGLPAPKYIGAEIRKVKKKEYCRMWAGEEP